MYFFCSLDRIALAHHKKKRVTFAEAENCIHFPRAVLFSSQSTPNSQPGFSGGNIKHASPVVPIPSQQPVDCVIKVIFYEYLSLSGSMLCSVVIFCILCSMICYFVLLCVTLSISIFLDIRLRKS